jgi:hypothetical protein
MRHIPIACTLTTGDLQERLEDWATVVRSPGSTITMTDAGVQIEVEPSMASDAERLVAAERECCGWATWSLVEVGPTLLVGVTSDDEVGVKTLQETFNALTQ